MSYIIKERDFGIFHSAPGGRLLLMATIALMPLQDHFASLGGFGFMFFAFGGLAIYVIIRCPQAIDRVWLHPVFVASYAFIGITSLLEFASEPSRYEEILRFGQMVIGAVFIGSLCSDRPALKACLYGYIGGALWVGVILFLTTYGTLQGVSASNYTEASLARVGAMRDVPLGANPNGMALNCLQGGAVALAFAITQGHGKRRIIFLGLSVFCLLASCLTMSRGGIAIAGLACAAILYAYGAMRAQSWMFAATIGLMILMLTPDAVWTRMDTSALSIQGDLDQMEGRTWLYAMAWQHLPDYIFLGLGDGGALLGDWSCCVHNSFLQIAVFWGLPGLLAFGAMIWQAYKCVPNKCGKDGLALGLIGITISMFGMLFFISNYNEKFFAFGLGLLVAAHCWIWPNGQVISNPGEDAGLTP